MFNEITKTIIQFFEVPFYFDNHTLNCYDKKYESKFNEKGDILEDYALILKSKNPYDDKKNLIMIVGCNVYGCLSGAIAITNIELLRNICQEIKSKSIGVIIKSHIIHDTPQKPFLLKVFKIENKINVKIP